MFPGAYFPAPYWPSAYYPRPIASTSTARRQYFPHAYFCRAFFPDPYFPGDEADVEPEPEPEPQQPTAVSGHPDRRRFPRIPAPPDVVGLVEPLRLRVHLEAHARIEPATVTAHLGAWSLRVQVQISATAQPADVAASPDQAALRYAVEPHVTFIEPTRKRAAVDDDEDLDLE